MIPAVLTLCTWKETHLQINFRSDVTDYGLMKGKEAKKPTVIVELPGRCKNTHETDSSYSPQFAGHRHTLLRTSPPLSVFHPLSPLLSLFVYL